MIGLLEGVLLRQLPDAALSGIASGELKVFGSVVRSVADGRIRFHLQETSSLTSLLTKGVPSLDPIGLVAQGVAIAQNEQIKAALEIVKTMQVASLALGVATLGVSVAGTALVVRRIALLEKKVDALAPQLEAISGQINALQLDRIAEDFARLRTVADQLDDCWLLGNATSEWGAVAREAHFLADNFSRRAKEADALHGEPFSNAFAVASSLRVTARLAAGDDEAARRAAQWRAETLLALGRRVQLGSLALEAVPALRSDGGSPAWQEELDARASDFAPEVAAAREREISAAATVATLEALYERRIRGRDWLEAAREETEMPLLALPVPG